MICVNETKQEPNKTAYLRQARRKKVKILQNARHVIVPKDRKDKTDFSKRSSDSRVTMHDVGFFPAQLRELFNFEGGQGRCLALSCRGTLKDDLRLLQ